MTTRSTAVTARPSTKGRAVRTRTLLPGTDGTGTVRRSVLPGGLRVVTETLPTVRSATFGIWAGVGSRDETPVLNGATHYLEHLLFKGTRRRSALDISAAIDAVGGEMNAFTAKEYTCYYARVLDTDLPLAIDVVSDMLTGSLIRQEDIDAERGVVLEEIAMTEDDPGDQVHDLFTTALLGDSPLGRPVLGTVETINSLTRDQIARFYRKHYDPTRLVVAAAGNIEHAAVVRQVRRAFEQARRARRPRGRTAVPARWRPDDPHRRTGRTARPAHRAGPCRPRHARALPHRRTPLGAQRAQHRARRRYELAALPGDPREARTGVLGVLLHLVLRGLRHVRRVHAAASRAGCPRCSRSAGTSSSRSSSTG